jgi:hypothetical protein
MQNNNKINLNLRPTDKGIIILVKVIPGSSKSELSDIIDGVLKIKLNSPPIEGKANSECIKILSKFLNIPKSSIEIINGAKSKNKSVLIKCTEEYLKTKIDQIQKKTD